MHVHADPREAIRNLLAQEETRLANVEIAEMTAWRAFLTDLATELRKMKNYPGIPIGIPLPENSQNPSPHTTIGGGGGGRTMPPPLLQSHRADHWPSEHVRCPGPAVENESGGQMHVRTEPSMHSSQPVVPTTSTATAITPNPRRAHDMTPW